MKNVIVVFFTCLLMSGQIMAADHNYGLAPSLEVTAPADQGSLYDKRDGFTYAWKRDRYGEIRLQGYHPSGATNSFRVKPNRDMDGFDSKGNYWTYNHLTGMFFNFGTEEAIFTGKQP